MQETNKGDLIRILKQQRILLELTQDGLAKKAGVSPTLISRLERGKRYPSPRTLNKLAKVLGINEIELFIHDISLSQPSPSRIIEEDTRIMTLDPKVVFELSKEPLKTQRAVLAILKMLRSIAADIALENAKDGS